MISHVENCDCKAFMGKFPDKFFDLAVVDPPYGIGAECGTNQATRARFKHRKADNWDTSPPDTAYFNELRRVSKNQIVWGGNYFSPGYFKHFFVWDKGLRGLAFGDCEMAVGSFDQVPRVFTFNPTHPKNRMNKIHPVQKPIDLYKFILAKYAKAGDKILDTHLGSGAHRIAAHQMGLDFWASELDPGYFADSCEWFESVAAQGDLFEPTVPTQAELI